MSIPYGRTVDIVWEVEVDRARTGHHGMTHLIYQHQRSKRNQLNDLRSCCYRLLLFVSPYFYTLYKNSLWYVLITIWWFDHDALVWRKIGAIDLKRWARFDNKINKTSVSIFVSNYTKLVICWHKNFLGHWLNI